jgi:hypothetical protein
MYRNFGKKIRRELGLKSHEIVHKPPIRIGGETRVLRNKDKQRSQAIHTRHGKQVGVTLRDEMKIQDIRKTLKKKERTLCGGRGKIYRRKLGTGQKTAYPKNTQHRDRCDVGRP